MPKSLIIGSGSFIPERIIKSSFFYDTIFYDDNNKIIDKEPEEILKKFVEITEIEERRYLDENLVNSDMGKIASENAIKDADIDKNNIDYIICASNFGDIDIDGNVDFMPSISARIKHKLDITNRSCITYDLPFGCPGWVESMKIGDILLKSGNAKNILVVGSDNCSRAMDPNDRNKMIFADGAGAVVLSAVETDEDCGILFSKTYCDNGEELNYLKCGKGLNPSSPKNKNYVRMQGRKIYEYALKFAPQIVKDTLSEYGISITDIDKILIHQANAKMDHAIIDRVFKLYGINDVDHNIAPMTIQKLGNTSVACLPTLYDLISKKQYDKQEFKKGSYILFISIGAGMNINCIIYKFPK